MREEAGQASLTKIDRPRYNMKVGGRKALTIDLSDVSTTIDANANVYGGETILSQKQNWLF